MLKKRLLLVGSILLVTQVAWAAASSDDPCSLNLAKHYNVYGRMEYSTWQEFSDLVSTDAYQILYAVIKKDGWKITNADENKGVISAEQRVNNYEPNYRKNYAERFDVSIKASGTGSKVSFSFSPLGNHAVEISAVQKSFCGYLNSLTQ